MTKKIVVKNCSECHHLIYGVDERDVEIEWCNITHDRINDESVLDADCPYRKFDVSEIPIHNCAECPHTNYADAMGQEDGDNEPLDEWLEKHSLRCLHSKNFPFLDEKKIHDEVDYFCPLDDADVDERYIRVKSCWDCPFTHGKTETGRWCDKLKAEIKYGEKEKYKIPENCPLPKMK